jgi:two-component system alkaline phosphatase synthesis response regulator PhoP
VFSVILPLEQKGPGPETVECGRGPAGCARARHEDGKILIIEDEADLVKAEAQPCGRRLRVAWAADGREGCAALEDAPDLVILDIMLPRMNGLEVCRSCARRRRTSPSSCSPPRARRSTRSSAEIGADDYITKPFSHLELLARIKAHLRREKREPRHVQKICVFGEIEIDFAHFKVRRAGSETDLTSLEVDILKYLIAHKGEVVSRDALLDKVWGYENFPTTRTIDNHILKLRKIEDDPSPCHILSVYGEGTASSSDDDL